MTCEVVMAIIMLQTPCRAGTVLRSQSCTSAAVSRAQGHAGITLHIWPATRTTVPGWHHDLASDQTRNVRNGSYWSCIIDQG
jgi:hypothetical protein